jgi:hypothetical protein
VVDRAPATDTCCNISGTAVNNFPDPLSYSRVDEAEAGLILSAPSIYRQPLDFKTGGRKPAFSSLKIFLSSNSLRRVVNRTHPSIATLSAPNSCSEPGLVTAAVGAASHALQQQLALSRVLR